MFKIGIITFHHSYNCGSMLQAYALQTELKKLGYMSEIINFSNEGQRRLYSVTEPNDSFKNILKNIILYPHRERIEKNYNSYEKFMKSKMILSLDSYSRMEELTDKSYGAVITGSDQVWNITIADADDAYYLPWVNSAKKIAYAPSFGAKNPGKFSADPQKYKMYLSSFDALSVRENNGKLWIRELIGKDVPVLLDPTLLLESIDYETITDDTVELPNRYIFFYSPSYQKDIVKLVYQLSVRYGLPVVAFNAKTFYVKNVKQAGFSLPEIENPSVYLSLIKKAKLVITTSFHGTIFSTIFKKNFWVIKNGGMYGDDDRVKTLLLELGIMDRLITTDYKTQFDYMRPVDYAYYENELPKLKGIAERFLIESLKF